MAKKVMKANTKSHIIAKKKAPARPASKSTTKGGLKGFSKPSAH